MVQKEQEDEVSQEDSGGGVTRQRGEWIAANVHMAMLLAAALVGLWATPDRAMAIGPLALLLAGVAACHTLALGATSPRRLRWATALFLTAGVIAAVYGFLTVPWEMGKIVDLPLYRQLPHLAVAGDTTNTNVLAGALVLVIPAILALLLARGLHWPLRLLLLAALFVMAGVLALTQAPAPLAALGVGLAAMLVLWNRRTLWLLIPAGLVGAGALVYLSPAYLVGLLPMAIGFSGWASRREAWTRTLTAIGDFPFTGLGLGAFQRVMPLLYPSFLSEKNDVSHAHQLYLQVAADLGLVGLVAFVGLLVLALVATWRGYAAFRRQGRGLEAALAVGLFGGLVAAAVHGFFDAATWNARPQVFLFAALGLALAVGRPSPLAPRRGRLWARRRLAVLSVAVAACFVIVALVVPDVASAACTNLGALELERGLLNREAAHLERAEGWLQRAVAWDDDNPRARRLLGQLRLWRGDVVGAVEPLQQAMALAPGDGYAGFYLGWASWRLGSEDDAAAAWERAGRSLGGLAFYLDRQRGGMAGDDRWAVGIPDTAANRAMIRRVGEASVAGGERHVWLYHLLARLSEDKAQALHWLEEGWRANPGSWVPVAELANEAFRQGDYGLSQMLWQEAIRLSPPRADYQFHLGQAYEAEGKWQEALAAYERAVEGAPENTRYRQKVEDVRQRVQ